MNNWTSLLRSTLPSPCFDRPFVCDGFPSASQVIVIGENPATELSVDWWSFWSPESGFDYQSFLSHYLEQRALRGKGLTNTRRRLDRFRRNGVLCVETNAYQNESAGGAGSGISNYAILNLLTSNMPNLGAIVAHGKIAQQFLDSAALPPGVASFRTRHFRMESYDVIDAICRSIQGDA